jgi:probable biosynthetic protein (TIGR04098 family)
MYFSEAAVKGNGGSIRATLMSSFSKFGQSASNMSLLKGLPEIPSDFAIPLLSEFPEFGQDYRTRRSQASPAAIFECEYEIIPSYDINGVGLLYFAAYPIINDICAARHGGRSLMMDFSTLRRDVFYFGNSNPDEILLYRLHEWRSDERSIDMTASISRKSDGNVIANVLTRKVRPDGGGRAG